MSVGIRTAALCAAIACVMAAAPSHAAVAAPSSMLRRYPYLTDLVTTNVTINWATTTAGTTGSVTYGRVGTETCTAHTASATKTTITVGSTTEYQWKAMLSGLATNTAYCYRVFAGTTDLLGSDPSPVFHSQVPAGSNASYSFAVFGDWGAVDSTGSNPDQARLMSQVAASGARFAINTGDTAYNSGTQTNYGDLVQTGTDTSAVFGPSFWTVASSSIAMFAAQGNHGMNSVPLTNWPEDRAVAASGGRYQMDTYCCANGTSSKSYPSMWYAFDAGPARFYVLEAAWANSNVGSTNLYDNDYDAHWLPSSPEYQWLSADLAAHPTAMKFAFFHFPVYSANSTEASDTFLSGPDHLEGLLADHGVDVIFNGHAHIYDRNLPSGSGMPVAYVTGGGGAPLEPVSRCTNVAYAIGWSYSSSTHGSSCGSAPRPTTIDRAFHFLLVTVNGSRVTVTPIDELGRAFDAQTYTFGGGGASDTQAPTSPTNLTAAPSAGQISLAWSGSTDNVGVTGYRVIRDGATIATLGSAARAYTDTSVAPATTYTYTVRAFDAAGNTSPPSNAASATTPAGTGQLTVAPTDDAYIRSDTPGSNFGQATTVQTDGSPIKDFLMRFAVSGIGSKTVTSATLRLYCVDPSDAGGTFRPTATSTWNEGSVTWANAPATLSAPTATRGSVTAGTWVTVDVKPFVTGDGVVSFRVSSSSSNGADYTSSEGATGFTPQLIVTTG